MPTYSVQIALIMASTLLLLGIFAYSAKNCHIFGAREFSIMLAFPLVFSFASLMELIVTEPAQILAWRNIAQLGNFLGPVAGVFFAMTFAGYQRGFVRRVIPFLLIIPSISLFSIFLPQYSDIMRSSVEFVEVMGRTSLLVESTLFGSLSIAANMILNIMAILILLSVKGAELFVKQARLIAFGLLVISILIFIKILGFMEQIDMSLLYLPGLLIVLYGIFRYELIAVSPVACNKVFEVLDEGIVVSTLEGRIININPAGAALFRQLTESLPPPKKEQPLKLKTNAENMNKQAESLIAAKYPHWWKIISACTSGDTEFSAYINEELRTYLVNIYKLREKGLNKVGSVSILRDISAERAEKDELTKMAVSDRLTGLYDQSYIKESIANEVERSKRYQSLFSLIMFDLDNFKAINDRHGHTFGDEVLVAVASAARNVFRQSDLIARYGGDEFLVMLPETGQKSAESLAERLQKELEGQQLDADGQEVVIQASIGIAVYPFPEKPNCSPIEAVDRALYDAKTRGKNRYSTLD